MGKHLHVIPVPDGYTADDAFDEIEVMGGLVNSEVSDDGDGGKWAVVACDGTCSEAR